MLSAAISSSAASAGTPKPCIAKEKRHGEIHPPGKPSAAPETPCGSQRRGHPEYHPKVAGRGGGEGLRTAEGTRMNRRGIELRRPIRWSGSAQTNQLQSA